MLAYSLFDYMAGNDCEVSIFEGFSHFGSMLTEVAMAFKS